MEKFLKRTLATIMVVLMVLTSAPLSGFVGFNFAPKANAEMEVYEVINPFILQAESLSGLTSDSQAETMPHSYFEIYIENTPYSPSKEFVDSVKNDSFVMTMMKAWEGFSSVGNMSDAVGQVMTASDYCEVIILQIMNSTLKDNQFLSSIKELAIEDAATLTDNICEVFKVGSIAEIIDDTSFDINSLHNNNLIAEAVENSFDVGMASEICGAIGDIITYSQDISQVIDKIAMYATLINVDTYTKNWLASMYNSADNYTYMKTALGKLLIASQSTTGAILSAVQTTSTTLTKWVVSEAINVSLNVIAKANPVVAAIFAGFSISTTICNLFFGSSDICEQFHVLEQLNIAQELARVTALKFKNNFVSNRTTQNALNLTKSVELYFNTITNVEIDCVLKFMKTLYTSGVKGWLSSMQKSYNECVETYEGTRTQRKIIYNKMLFFFAAAYKMKCPRLFETYYGKDSIWTIDYDNYTYKIQDNVAILEECVQTVSGTIVIPKKIFGFDVTEIGSYAFSGCVGLKIVTLNQGLKTIGMRAFSGTSITSITIPNTVTSMYRALVGAEKLKEVIFQSGIIKIPPGSLSSCSSVTSVTIPSTVTEIGVSAFEDCIGLASVTIPGTVTKIEGSAFAGCSGLTSVTIPDSVMLIDGGAFEDCIGLTSVTIPSLVTEIGCYAFSGCIGLKSITLNQGLKIIGYKAFNGTSLTSVTVPKTVANMSYVWDGSCFEGADKLETVVFENGITVIPYKALAANTSIVNIVIPSSVEKIGNYAFSECDNLSNVYYSKDKVSWSKIEIGNNNTPLSTSTIHYNSSISGDLHSHSYITTVTKVATCTATGTKKYTCSCGDNYTQTIAKLGHSFASSYTTDKKATCSVTGSKSKHCTRSGCTAKTSVTSIPKLSHTYTNTCDATCNVCSSKRTIKHSYSNACDKECNVCKATRSISHSYKTSITKATISKNGKTVDKCTVCGVSKTTTIYYPKTIKLSTTTYTYNGSVKTPTITVKDSNSKTLKKGTDYTLSFASGRKNTGKYSVTVTFKGKYSGKKVLYFNILPSKTSKITPTCGTTSIKASWKKVTGASGYKVELLNSKGKVVKTVATTKTAYTFEKLSKVTTYKIKVTAYKTIDSKKVYSTVSTTITTSTAPAKATLSKVTAGSNSATPTWKKVSSASGYEVMYSTSSKFSSSKTATVSKGSSTKTTIKKLTKGKKYYFKVRAYKTVDGKKIYSAWSAVKSVKVK